MPKCPNENCNGRMKKNDHGVWVCKKCGSTFADRDTIKSIFGVTS